MKLNPKQKAQLSMYYPELTQWLNQSEDSGGNTVADALAAEILKKIEMVKGEKGDKGDKGDIPIKGVDYWTNSDVKQLINVVLQGATPIKGKHYFDGEKGDSYILTSKDKREIANQVDVPIVDKIIEKTEVIKEVLLKDLDTVSKKDFEIREKKILDGMARVDGRIKLIDQRWGGHGGVSKVSTDSTLTGNGTPSSPLHVVGGGSGATLVRQIVTGTVDGSNKNFTVAASISGVSFIDLNGQLLADSGVDYTASGTTITYVIAPPNTGGNDTHYIYSGGAVVAGSVLTPTETPNGARTTFTFASATAQPSFLIVDNAIMRAVTKSGVTNWTWVGTVATLLCPPPNEDIVAVV